MKRYAALWSLAALVSVSAAAHAGGPVAVEDEGEPVVLVEETSSSSLPGSLPFSLGGAGGLVGLGALTAVLFAVSESSGSHGSNVGN